MIRLLAPACALLLAAIACQAASSSYPEGDFAAVEKVDVHVHLYGDMPVFAAQAQKDGFRVLTINVNYRDFPPIAVQQRDAAALARANPERIAFAATFDAAGSDQPGWLAGVEQGLDAALAEGAVAVKFWKDIGMQHRDPDGRAAHDRRRPLRPAVRLARAARRARARPPGRAAQRLAAARRR